MIRWAYEILTIFASFLGTEAVAAQTIIIQTIIFASMIPIASSMCITTLVGNAIGANEIALAKDIGNITLALSIAIQACVGLLIFSLGTVFIDSFTIDPQVRHICYEAIPFISFFTMMDCLQSVVNGIFRGCGKQYIAAVTNTFSFYGIGLPMAYYLAFHVHWNVIGLVFGLALGCSFQVTVGLSFIYGWSDLLFTSVIDVVEGNTSTDRERGHHRGDYELVSNVDGSRSKSSELTRLTTALVNMGYQSV